MRLSILGPLEVTGAAGTPVSLRGAKQRRLLLALVLGRGEAVPTDRLLDVVWPEGGLTDPRNALQVKASQLRRLLAPAGQVELRSTPTGYVLDVPPGAVDAWRFESLVERGRAAVADGRLTDAEHALAEALGLWRGPALVDLTDEQAAAPTIAALEELRASAVELRAEVQLELGRLDEAVATLQDLLVRQPLRERSAGLLITALGRAGRQADAVDTYQRTRVVLQEELGIDPGPELQRRYEQLLRQEDAATRTPATAAAATGAAGRSTMWNALPTPISSFVGRAGDVERVRALVAGGRLVTLTGPGGVGKTRLALETAHTLTDGFAGGTWWVELAPLQPGADVVDALVRRLGLHDPPAGAAADGSAFERLVLALSRDQVLLILDNAEHLMAEVAELVHGLLRRVASLTVLCTSREALGIAGELVWSVPSLSLPSVGAPSVDARSEAIELFVTRAREADPGFSSDDPATAAAIAALCRRLDGIPLAIELAAARVPVLSPARILRRFEDDRGLLHSRDRTAPARQRTLQDVVDWSWQLLDAEERMLCRRLAVFRGGWTLEASELVCADDELPAEHVLDILARLVSKSLVTVDPRGERYGKLETLRDHALRQLDAARETNVLRARHARWVAGLVAEQVPRLRTSDQLIAVATLDRELPNVREALAWLLDHDPELGAEIAVDAGWFWYLRDHRADGRRWLTAFTRSATPDRRAMATLWDRFLALEEVPTTALRDDIEAAAAVVDGSRLAAPDRATAHLVAAFTASSVNAAADAERHLARARDIATTAADAASLATADFVEARDRLAHGDLSAGRALTERALAGFRDVGDRWGQVQCLIALVSLAGIDGDADAGLQAAREGITLAEELGLGELRAVLWAGSAMPLVADGDLDAAHAALATARDIAHGLGSRTIDTQIELATADVAAHVGDLDGAEAALERCLEQLVRLEATGPASMVLHRLGQVEEQRDRPEAARERYLAAHAAATEAGDRRVASAAHERLATLGDAGDRRLAVANDPLEGGE